MMNLINNIRFGGGPAIPRSAILESRSAAIEKFVVELRPFEISVALLEQMSDELEWIDYEFSKNDTIYEVFEQVKRSNNLDSKPCKLWKATFNTPSEEIKITSETKDLTLDSVLERRLGQRFIIEVGPHWSIEPSQESSNSGAMRTSSNNSIVISGKAAQEKKRYGDNAPPGVCGLSNLGNTCFMNSGLQCLTHAPCFYEYFTNDVYVNEINKTNPLGMGGSIATAFGDLMKEMWSGENSYTSPTSFKRVIGKYAPQFAGYQQQDSQELISFLLDGLHEDLNRIHNKPVTSQVEAKGREDSVVAAEAWDVHRLRNDSIIVDKFQGQLKSTLICPKCKNVSVTFDPFMYLTLPIPVEKNRLINLLVFFNTTLSPEMEKPLAEDETKLGNFPVKLTVKVNKTGSVAELRDAVLEQLGFDPALDHDRCLIFEIFSSRVYKYLSDHDSISQILEADTLQCQILPKTTDFIPAPFTVTGESAQKLLALPKDVHTLYLNRSSYNTMSQQLPFLSVKLTAYQKTNYGRYSFQTIGLPYVVPLGSLFRERSETDDPSDLPTNADLYEYLFHYMSRYFSQKLLDEVQDAITNKGCTFKDFLPTKEKMELIRERKQRKDESQEEEEDTDFIFPLFYIKYEQEMSRSNDVNEITLEGVVPCDEEIISPPTSKYSNAKTEKKTIFMHIPEEIFPKLLDYPALQSFKVHPSVDQKISSGADSCSINQCLELYTTTEKLSAQDTWYCPVCKDHVEATKKFDIWKVPDILVVHLKRFQFSQYSRDKIDRFIDFPIEDLDMSPYVHCHDGSLKYDLFAISDHFGGLGGGHYTACAKNHLDGKWYKFDDSRTGSISNPESMKSHSNYVLFYVARKE